MTQSPSPSLTFPDLAERFQDRYTDNAFERSFYTRDLAPVPELVARFAGQTLPDAVVRPRSAEEVAHILRWASDRRVPVTPRAAATSAYWNAVPVKGGLVLDLNDLRGLVAVDKEARTATVLPATRWLELDVALHRQGLALLSYPTSAPAATVGGWLSMQGHGVGSLRYGSMADQVAGLEVALPDGTVAEATPGSRLDPSVFASAEGTRGVITRIVLAVRQSPEAEAACLFAFAGVSQLQRAAESMAAISPRPVYLHFADKAYGELLHRAGFADAAGEGHHLSVVFDGSPGEVAASAAAATATAEAQKGERLDYRQADQEWRDRFRSLRVKRAGPTLLAAESWLPLARLAEYWERVLRLSVSQRTTMATYGMVVKPGWLTVMTVYPSDERRVFPYLLDLSLTRQLYATAIALGGLPYGTGFWNAPYRSGGQGRDAIKEGRSQKARMDPMGIMNPGKMEGVPWWLHPAVFGSALRGASVARRLGGVSE